MGFVFYGGCGNSNFGRDSKVIVGVQGLSAVMASGVSAVVTMPLDSIR